MREDLAHSNPRRPDRVELGSEWAVMVGARHDRMYNSLSDELQAGGIDRSGSVNFTKTTARAGLSWNPVTEIGAYANWSQGFLPPATEELANNPDNLGGFNTHLVPATSTAEELGVRGQLADWMIYDVAGFHMRTHNDFGRYRVPTRPLETFYQNAGTTERWGIETALAAYPTEELRLQIAYTYSHFMYTTVHSIFGDFTDKVMPNAPAHQASADAEYVLAKHWVFGIGSDAVSRWYVDQTNNAWAVGYVLLHARIGFRWRGEGYRAEILGSGRNILGTEYIAFTEPDPDGNSYQPAPTQEFFVNARISLGN